MFFFSWLNAVSIIVHWLIMTKSNELTISRSSGSRTAADSGALSKNTSLVELKFVTPTKGIVFCFIAMVTPYHHTFYALNSNIIATDPISPGSCKKPMATKQSSVSRSHRKSDRLTDVHNFHTHNNCNNDLVLSPCIGAGCTQCY